jgi:hypothetical protein
MAEITPSISAESAPIKVLRIITRMNIGGPAVQVSGLMQGMDNKHRILLRHPENNYLMKE